jgi:hypothetical protein
MQRLVKSFRFEERNRAALTFSDSDKIRLNSSTPALELVVQSIEKSTGKNIYPLDEDLYATIEAFNPEALVQWVGFSLDPHVSYQPDNTSITFRLNDGTDDYYWDGASWSAPSGASDWSTENDVVTNIDSFPTTSKELAVIVRLKTTDKYETPSLKVIDLLMDCNVIYMQSLVESLLQDLKENLRPIVNVSTRALGGTYVSLSDLETPFDIQNVFAVYNHTSDPGHITNLYSSYDASSKVITLSSSIDRGAKLWIDFTVEPAVYLNWGDEDYVYLTKIPAVVLDRVDTDGNQIIARQSSYDVVQNTAEIRNIPFRLQVAIDVLLVAESNRTLLSMQDDLYTYFGSRATLRWRAIDELVAMRMVDEGNIKNRPNTGGMHQLTCSVILQEVYLWVRPVEQRTLVQDVVLSLSDPTTEGGVQYTGSKHE